MNRGDALDYWRLANIKNNIMIFESLTIIAKEAQSESP